jgi:hypothetical protein
VGVGAGAAGVGSGVGVLMGTLKTFVGVVFVCVVAAATVLRLKEA